MGIMSCNILRSAGKALAGLKSLTLQAYADDLEQLYQSQAYADYRELADAIYASKNQ